MLVVLARTSDSAAQKLVDCWRANGAALLSPQDLSVQGWRYTADPKLDTAVVQGRVVPVVGIEGLLSRLAGVLEEDLNQIVVADRAYVAAEMNAFLLAWLSRLPCRVLNRPTATSLCGPGMRREQWIALAGRIGIPVRPFRRRTAMTHDPTREARDPSDMVVTVLGDRCLGTVDTLRAADAKRVARAAGVELLTVYFSAPPNSVFIDATLWPNSIDDDLAKAIRQYLLCKDR